MTISYVRDISYALVQTIWVASYTYAVFLVHDFRFRRAKTDFQRKRSDFHVKLYIIMISNNQPLRSRA